MILGKALEWGYIPLNPAAYIKVQPEGRKLPNPFWKDEIERLLAQLPHRHCRIAELYLHTGLRRGELMNLLWGDVDFAAGTLTIRQPKNRRDRTVPMSQRVKEIFRQRRREWEEESQVKVSDLRVFGAAADIRQVLNRAAVRAGIERGRRGRLQHRLRDTFITVMVEKGIPLDRVQLLAGHNSIEMTRRYAETRPEALKQAIAQVFDQ